MPETKKIFAYGSLLNEASLRKTVPNAASIYPAKVYGFRRVFNLASHYRFCTRKQSPVCVLNLERADSDSVLNGLCFEMDGSTFAALKSREQIYQMHEVAVHRYNGDGPPQSANLFWARDHELFRYLSDSEAQRHYLDLCITGCQVFGSHFLNDFKMSTGFWGIDSEEEIGRIWQGKY
jgi:cation transport regulator ChaC